MNRTINRQTYKTLNRSSRTLARQAKTAQSLGAKVMAQIEWAQKMLMLRVIHAEIEPLKGQKIAAQEYLDTCAPCK